MGVVRSASGEGMSGSVLNRGSSSTAGESETSDCQGSDLSNGEHGAKSEWIGE